MMVEKAKGAAATGDEVNNFLEWLLCTWDPAHRMELVANDIRVDREGVNVELLSVPWYSQIPKDISAMHATCSYIWQAIRRAPIDNGSSRSKVVCHGKVL